MKRFWEELLSQNGRVKPFRLLQLVAQEQYYKWQSIV